MVYPWVMVVVANQIQGRLILCQQLFLEDDEACPLEYMPSKVTFVHLSLWQATPLV